MTRRIRFALAAGLVLAIGASPTLALANELYVTLLGPVETLTKDKRSLLVVPSGALTALPFHLLVTEKPQVAIPDRLEGYRNADELSAVARDVGAENTDIHLGRDASETT